MEKEDSKAPSKKVKRLKGKKTKGEIKVVKLEVPPDETDKKRGLAEVRDLQLLEPRDRDATYEAAFRAGALPDEVYGAYAKLLQLARNINAGAIPFPEFVLLGHVGSGKSSLVELITGQHNCNVVGSASTLRPVFFQFVNNRNIKLGQQKVTVKRDPQSGLQEYERDLEVVGGLANLEEELRRRMGTSLSKWPIYVTIESCDSLNWTLIDTPGLGTSKEADSISLGLATSAHRHIVAVQAATPEPENYLLASLAPIDPDLTRTTLVYSNFYSVLRVTQSADALGRFFSRTPEGAHTFFSTLPFFSARQSVNTRDEYREVVFKAVHRDLDVLESLQIDKDILGSVGSLALREWIRDKVWRQFQQYVPVLLQTAMEGLSWTQKDLALVRSQVQSLQVSKLRALASNYTTEFLQCVGSLLLGTAEGNSVVNGETLDEEKHAHGDAAWRTSTNMPLSLVGELDVPLKGSKLYGGQQLERLLAEFMAVANRSELPEPSLADVANAAGINKLSNSTDITWAAADLAQQKSRDALSPLIKQLGSRAFYIMKRLGDISRRVMDVRRREGGNNAAPSSRHQVPLDDLDDATRYPAFRHFVRDNFDKFVEEQVGILLVKCQDEFYSTRTIHFSCSEDALRLVGDVDSSNPEAVKKAVVTMAKHIFSTLRARIVKNTVLKVYSFLLVPCQSALWSSLQAAVSSLSDKDLEQKFDVKNTVSKLNAVEKQLEERAETLSSQRGDVQKNASIFCM